MDDLDRAYLLDGTILLLSIAIIGGALILSFDWPNNLLAVVPGPLGGLVGLAIIWFRPRR